MMRACASILLTLVVAGCAQVREPSGGDRDTASPQLLAAEPPSGTTGFQGDRIVLRFDERIKLGGADKVLVSPPLAAKPAVRMLGSNAVVVELKAPLDGNTTYVFNIGDAVSDLTEGNTAAGLLYVISSGDHLDSLHVQGVLLNASTGKPEKDALVMLYDAANDTGFLAGRPSYYTRTLENGAFALSYLRPGRYEIHALRDQNGNYRYDLPIEEIAFLPEPVESQASDTVVHVLHLFREVAKEQALITARAQPDGALRLVFARPAAEVALEPVEWSGGNLRWLLETNAVRDTVLCWPSDTTLLQGRLYRVVADGVTVDTVQYQRREKMPFNVGLNLVEQEGLGGPTYSLHATRPLERVDAARTSVAAPSGLLAPGLVLDDPDRRIVRLTLPPGIPPEASLLVLPKAVQDIYGGTNDTLRFTLGGPAPDEMGQLIVGFEGPGTVKAGGILQVLTSQDQVLREIRVDPGGDRVGPFALQPGTYGLRLVEDRDGNGRWDTGDLALGREPEMVRRYEGMILVRAGWDVNVAWGPDPR